MNFKENIISLAAASLSFTIICSANFLAEQQSAISFLNFMARSKNLMQRNPTRSTECFKYYIPLIERISKTYQEEYEVCKNNSRNRRLYAETDTLHKRNYLASLANNSCNLLSQCSEIESAKKGFECFINASSENAKTMYTVNNNASDYLTDLKEQLLLIENDEFKCTNETKRTFERESIDAYANLNNCIMGIFELPLSTEDPRTSEKPEGIDSSEGKPSDELLPEEDISF